MTQSSTSRCVSTRVSDSAPGRFALESPISLSSNGIGGEGDFSSNGIGKAEKDEEFSFLVCVCCFLPPQICARSKIVEEDEGGGKGKIMSLHREEEEEGKGVVLDLQRDVEEEGKGKGVVLDLHREEEEEAIGKGMVLDLLREEEGIGKGMVLDLHREEEEEEEEEEAAIGEGKIVNFHRYRPWFDLPTDILDIVVGHLQFVDYVRFGAVCKSWRSITAHTPHLRALQHPWLAILDKSAFFSPVEDRLYHPDIPFASNSRYIGRSQGCLIFMDESEGGHIFNLFTNQTFKFPYSRDLKVSRRLERADLSSAPLRAGAARDCVLVVFFSFRSLGFCRPGDRDLFLHDCREHSLLDVVFFKGLLYCLTLHFSLVVFEFGPGPEMKYTESYIALDSVERRNIRHDDVNLSLAEFAGELLMVVKYWEFTEEDWDACRTVGFGVFKLDFSVPKWVEVETIGDTMLLLDDNCLHGVYAMDLSAYGFRPNCIYFTDGELDKYDWCMFSLEDKKIQPFSPTSSWAMKSPLILIKPSNA